MLYLLNGSRTEDSDLRKRKIKLLPPLSKANTGAGRSSLIPVSFLTGTLALSLMHGKKKKGGGEIHSVSYSASLYMEKHCTL